MKTRQAGITLLEVMLVLVIGAGILYFSMQQYLSYRRDADIYQVRYNVDMLFIAMGNYFRANCAASSSPLNPQNPAFGASSVPITMSDLVSQGYLTEQLPISSIIDYNSLAQGYYLQFNQVQPPPSRTIQVYDNTTVSTGSIVAWEAQIGISLAKPATVAAYQQLLQADCLSNSHAGSNMTVVYPCGDPGSANGKIPVWSRLPSFPSTHANSDLWLTLPIVKLFTQMYNTYPILDLTDGTITNQYYTCSS